VYSENIISQDKSKLRRDLPGTRFASAFRVGSKNTVEKILCHGPMHN
jgi:hypothetical protein